LSVPEQILKVLRDRPQLPANFFAAGQSVPDLEPHVGEFPRQIDLEALVKVVDYAMKKFNAQPAGSDAWLAPRVHATLRLSREEAADKRMWWYLAVAILPDYVRWRFPPRSAEKGTPPNRFFGGESKQAFARLWWSAEFFRVGSDYGPVASAMRLSDVPNSLLMDYFHNRPMALAAVRVLESLNHGKPASSDDQTDVLQAANMMATTTVIDAFAPDPGPNAAAVAKWQEGSSDWTLMLTQDPEGPEEDGPDPASTEAAEQFLWRVAASVGLPKVGTPSAAG
jgi:hypothetical protein